MRDLLPYILLLVAYVFGTLFCRWTLRGKAAQRSLPPKLCLSPMLSSIALILLTHGFFSPVFAAAVPYSGVWVGTIGTQRIRVCFSTPNESRYYYSKHLHDIRLLAKTDSVNPAYQWQEVPSSGKNKNVSGIWKLDKKIFNNSLSGEWHSPQGRKKLVVRLEKVADLKNQSCGTAYNIPTEDLASERAKEWSVSFLPLTYKGASRFNAYARSWLLDKAGEAKACQSEFGNEAEFEFASLEDFTDKILVIREMQVDVYCGGAHNTSYIEYHTFDPQTGNKVNGWTWISAGEESVQTNSPLRILIEKLNPAADSQDCQNGFDVQPPYPTKDGFAFPTNFGWAGRACNSTVLIPYKKLSPYLTAEGKAVATSFRRR